MAPLPGSPNQGGGLPQLPGGGLPQRPQAPRLPGPPQRPRPSQPPANPQQAANAALRDALKGQTNPTGADVSQNDRLGQYDFDAQRPQSEDLNQGFVNTFDDEPAFDPEEERRVAEARAHQEAQLAQRFDRSMDRKKPAGKIKNNALKPAAGELDAKGQNVFIDKKNKKLEPFGGKKSALKQSDVDRRKNMRQASRAVSTVVILLLVAILGFGVKNAFWPPQSLSPQDVQQIVYNTTGTSAFPIERGRVFAETFMSAYMNFDPNGGAEAAVLNYYTTGKLITDGNINYEGFTISKNYKQTVVQGPVTYESLPVGPNSALYTIGALVEIENVTGGANVTPPPDPAPTPEPTQEPNTEGEGTEGSEGTEGGEESAESTAQTPATPEEPVVSNTRPNTASGTKLMWQFFSVNVYYDDETNAFAIVGTPALVPTPATVARGDIPADIPAGTGKPVESAVLEKLKPTIYGFLEAYRVSSKTDTAKLMPFLPDEPPAALLQGLNGEFDFKSGAADDRSVVINAYQTDIPTQWKISATVTWTQTLGDAKADYVSTYIMTIDQVASGYDVVKFVPTIYTPKID